MRILNDWLEAYQEYVDYSEAPLIYRIWVSISCVASALERKCWIVWDGKLFPNMYIVLVGHSGIKKGTAMTPGLDILRAVGINISANDSSRQALIRALAGSGSKNPIRGDKGIPMIHSSLTIFSKELSVFLGFENRELMSNLCDWYDCDPVWEYETIGRGKDSINNVWVNLIGATTREALEESLPKKMIGSGLTSRMILVYAGREEKPIWDPFVNRKNEPLKDKLVSDLRSVRSMTGEFTITDSFLKAYEPWYINFRLNPPMSDPRFRGYLNRRAIHLLKLSMISSASRTDSKIIDIEDFNRAVKLLELTEPDMPKVFAGVGDNPLASVTEQIIIYLIQVKEVTFRDLYDEFYRDVSSADLQAILGGLQVRQKINITPEGVIRYVQ